MNRETNRKNLNSRGYRPRIISVQKMDNEEFMRMDNALMSSMKRFPNCKIANCDCNSKQGERKMKCMCGCHIDDKRFKKGGNSK